MAEFISNIVPRMKMYKKKLENIDFNDFKSL